LVGDEVFVDHVGQLPFQAAPGFCAGLGLGEFAAIVVAAGSGIPGLATPTTGSVTGGVDTHGQTNHVAALDQLGRQLGDQEFPTTPGGLRYDRRTLAYGVFPWC